MSIWKTRVVKLVMTIISISSPLFIITCYLALYQAWLRGDLKSALPFLTLSRSFGIFAIAGVAAALVLLFLPKVFPVQPKIRLSLSLLVTVTIALFSEFRNEGKFYFKNMHHFFAPGTWIHDGLNNLFHSLGDFLYKIEYSHWNDFLMGPAIVSVLYSIAFFRIYNDLRDQGTLSLKTQVLEESTNLDNTLRFARILMNIGLFWFFIQAWAEKAGFLRNIHSRDEIDLPFEFAGTIAGFWMARVLTRPFNQYSEKFRSTFLIDFVSSGVIGLLYTFIVGPLTENVASAVGHALYSVTPASLDIHEYTAFQQHMRPLELLLLAVATWWILNRFSKHEEMRRLGGVYEEPNVRSKWSVLINVFKAAGLTIGFLLFIAAMFSLLEPHGFGLMLMILTVVIGMGIVAFILARNSRYKGFTTIFNKNYEESESQTQETLKQQNPPK